MFFLNEKQIKNTPNTCTIKNNHISLHTHYKSNAQDDSLAQQVEHIPFKDGVLGSNPRRITESLRKKLGKSLIIKYYQGFLFLAGSRKYLMVN